MTDKYSSMELEMGISSYMSPEHEGFAAVLKSRYSDFLVHEVDRDGNIARLESLEPESDMIATEDDIKPTESKKRKQPDTETEPSSEAADSEVKDPWKTAQMGLSAIVGSSEASEKTLALLQFWEKHSSGDTSTEESYGKFFTLPALKDKEARRSLHEFVRSALSFCALADTHEGRVRIWHKRFAKEMPNFGKFDRNNNNSRPKARWPSDRPDFLQFVLYKENVDTSVATKEVIHRLTRGGKRKIRIGYAGMKDKRAVTAQFCTLYRQDPRELHVMNQGGRGGGNTNAGGVSLIRVGNFRYVSHEVQLGTLNGNRFDVVLRNVEAGDSGGTIRTGAERLEETKKCLELAAQAFRQHGFINYFGMQRFGKYHDTHKVGLAILKGDFEAAVSIIMEPKPDEQFRSARGRKTWAQRFDKLEGDSADEKAKAQAEKDGAKQAQRDMGRFMTCENAILQSLMRKPLDYKRAFTCIPKTMRLMFLHAVQSYLWNKVASFRVSNLGRSLIVGDLVLTEDKAERDGGSGTSGLGGKAVKVVTSEDIAEGKYGITDLVLPLVGTKVIYPQNESGELFDSILAENSISKEQFGKVQDRELNLGGDYRKVVCTSTDVDFEIMEYSDPLQPLLQTDLMKMNGEELGSAKKETNGATAGKEGETQVILGMVIGFTLPPSSYATIALRELMKRPTSSEYQKQLKLEGPCEENLTKRDST